MTKNYSIRKEVAYRARQFYENSITFDGFMALVPDTDDAEIEELVDLIVHEPAKDGVLGVDNKSHEAYMDRIKELIKVLETP